MEWSDVKKIMEGTMPQPTVVPFEAIELKDYTKANLEISRLHTEIEAVLVVAVIVIQAVDGLKLKVYLQPSIEGHPVFTDFLFVVKSESKPVAFRSLP